MSVDTFGENQDSLKCPQFDGENYPKFKMKMVSNTIAQGIQPSIVAKLEKKGSFPLVKASCYMKLRLPKGYRSKRKRRTQ